MATTLPEYNGWPNRPTWCVHLWLTNEEPLYLTARDIARDGDPYDAEGVLRDFVEELCLGDEPPANMATDLLNWCLGCVDWRSIVDALREE